MTKLSEAIFSVDVVKNFRYHNSPDHPFNSRKTVGSIGYIVQQKSPSVPGSSWLAEMSFIYTRNHFLYQEILLILVGCDLVFGIASLSYFFRNTYLEVIISNSNELLLFHHKSLFTHGILKQLCKFTLHIGYTQSLYSHYSVRGEDNFLHLGGGQKYAKPTCGGMHAG